MSAPTSSPTATKTVVAKIGTSSLTNERGVIDSTAIERVVEQVAELRHSGHLVIVVTSAAVAAGLETLGMGDRRPSDALTLQAVSAVGQSRLMRVWDEAFARHDLVSGQVLLVPNDFFDRTQYLHARATLTRLLELGVVPVINENDAIADDEIRFGDNDRIAALVAHLVGADVLVLLTDTGGLYTADPRSSPDASLIAELDEVTPELERLAGGAGTSRGSGGMASKVRAAKIASWSGVRAVIARATRPGVLVEAVADVSGVGTTVRPHDRKLSARKLWIAFAVDPSGRVTVDDGARRALDERGVSLLPAGVVAVDGTFDEGDAVEISTTDGRVFARGLVRYGSGTAAEVAGRKTSELPPGLSHELIHRDDLVLLPS